MFGNVLGTVVASTALIVSASTAHAALFSDSFAATAVTPLDAASWTSYKNASNGYARQDGLGNFAATTGTRSAAYFAVGVTTAQNFDPFSQALNIQLNGLSVAGAPDPADPSKFANSYILIGRATTDSTERYLPNGSTMAYGIGLSIRTFASGYELLIQEYSDKATTTGGIKSATSVALSGVPTALGITIDGTGSLATLDLALTGATFTSGNTSTLSQTLSSDFNATNMTVGDSVLSRIALGALNTSGQASASELKVSDITVTVPEPAAIAGLVGGAALLISRRRRVS